RYWLVTELAPRVEFSANSAEWVLGKRDGAEIAIALELYRRKTGKYPDSLGELVGAYLPRLPMDRVMGEALHYGVVDGRPRVWSVGGEGKDDGGRAVETIEKPSPHVAKPGGEEAKQPADGDWVIYPPMIDENERDL